MTAARAIQNFRGFRGVWRGPSGHHEQALRAALGRLGVASTSFEAIGPGGLCAERDVLFVDSDVLFDPAPAAEPGHLLLPVPVIGVVGVEAPSRLKALSDIGATAFLHKPIHPATVYSALFLAVNNHARFARLEAQIEEHNRRRAGRRYVIRAVATLMQQSAMSDEQAYAHLRRESMRRRVGIEELARSLCDDPSALSMERQAHDASRNQAASHRRAGGEPHRPLDEARRARGPAGRMRSC
ncbi:MAG: ANTAR domain-containing protein [Proteobacteria bacterium]|nr:ANTAR domain-containing protein [Pseudomonadota bacterium]